MNATPRPWQVVIQGPALADVQDMRGLIVARCGKNTAEQDAALIVRAVNSHNTLVEGLRFILAEAEKWALRSHGHCERINNEHLVEWTRTLLATAEGKDGAR